MRAIDPGAAGNRRKALFGNCCSTKADAGPVRPTRSNRSGALTLRCRLKTRLCSAEEKAPRYRDRGSVCVERRVRWILPGMPRQTCHRTPELCARDSTHAVGVEQARSAPWLRRPCRNLTRPGRNKQDSCVLYDRNRAHLLRWQAHGCRDQLLERRSPTRRKSAPRRPRCRWRSELLRRQLSSNAILFREDRAPSAMRMAERLNILRVRHDKRFEASIVVRFGVNLTVVTARHALQARKGASPQVEYRVGFWAWWTIRSCAHLNCFSRWPKTRGKSE